VNGWPSVTESLEYNSPDRIMARALSHWWEPISYVLAAMSWNCIVGALVIIGLGLHWTLKGILMSYVVVALMFFLELSFFRHGREWLVIPICLSATGYLSQPSTIVQVIANPSLRFRGFGRVVVSLWSSVVLLDLLGILSKVVEVNCFWLGSDTLLASWVALPILLTQFLNKRAMTVFGCALGATFVTSQFFEDRLAEGIIKWIFFAGSTSAIFWLIAGKSATRTMMDRYKN
jgi:hypothetical protein